MESGERSNPKLLDPPINLHKFQNGHQRAPKWTPLLFENLTTEEKLGGGIENEWIITEIMATNVAWTATDCNTNHSCQNPKSGIWTIFSGPFDMHSHIVNKKSEVQKSSKKSHLLLFELYRHVKYSPTNQQVFLDEKKLLSSSLSASLGVKIRYKQRSWQPYQLPTRGGTLKWRVMGTKSCMT